MDSVAEVLGRYIDVALVQAALRDDEAEAARVGLETPDVDVHLFREREAVAANLNEVAGCHERLQLASERGALVPGNLEELQQFAGAGWMVHALAHERENSILRKHLMVRQKARSEGRQRWFPLALC